MGISHRPREEIFFGLVLALLALSAVGFVVWQAASPAGFQFAGFTVDRLSAVFSLLVGGVGWVTYRFSMRYLEGEPRKARFLRVLCLTVCAAYALMLATNLLVLLAAWTISSAGLHLLLTFYTDRPEAEAPARKKFLISRIGDLALVAAIFLIWRDYGTFNLHVFIGLLNNSQSVPNQIAVLLAVAALTKSAQFPFHSWLPETMESPTPVSALMHAGIINAGGAVLIRFAPLIARSAPALLLLVGVGTLTAVLGMLCMWAQVKVKRTLAWSTVSQMGFMMVQCGLGIFPAAALHILGHGFYKAWSFLRAGSIPGLSGSVTVESPRQTLTVAAGGTLAALPAIILAAKITGLSPLRSPGETALSCILALSIGQFWVALLCPPLGKKSQIARLAVAIGLTCVVAILVFCLYLGATVFLDPVIGPAMGPAAISHGAMAWFAATVPVAGIAALVVFHAYLPLVGRTAWGRAIQVHALHGFYFGALADLWIEKLWRNVSREGLEHA